MFFSPDGERGYARARRERAAKRICQDCPVLTECRTHAVTAAEPYGIWGGLSEADRNRRKRRTARDRRQTNLATSQSTEGNPKGPTHQAR